MEKNEKQKREEIIEQLYSIRSVLIQINYKAAEHYTLDLVSYSGYGVDRINDLIRNITQCDASDKRWTGLSETYQLKKNV